MGKSKHAIDILSKLLLFPIVLTCVIAILKDFFKPRCHVFTVSGFLAISSTFAGAQLELEPLPIDVSMREKEISSPKFLRNKQRFHDQQTEALNTFSDSKSKTDINTPRILETIPSAAVTNKPTYKTWSGSGCPDAWIEGYYQGGDLAEVDGVAYKCSSAIGANVWCGQLVYKPGVSIYWKVAWDVLGSCAGTISPTGSPAYVSLTDAGGCPDNFDNGMIYGEGDRVTVNGIVFQCRSWPNSVWCSMPTYEPDGVNSREAWLLMGWCKGELAVDSLITNLQTRLKI